MWVWLGYCSSLAKLGYCRGKVTVGYCGGITVGVRLRGVRLDYCKGYGSVTVIGGKVRLL